MYCHNCGTQLPDGARFCDVCGAPQITDTTDSVRQQSPSEPSQSASQATPQQSFQANLQQPLPASAATGRLLGAMRKLSIRRSILPLLIGLGVTVLLLAAGGPAVGLGVGLILLIPCALPMIRALSGSYQKEALELLQTENCFEQADLFYASTAPVRDVYMGSQFVYFQQGGKSVLLRPWDVAWVYRHVTRHYALFIPMGNSHSILIRTMAGKSYERFMSKQECEKFLEAVKTALPGAVVGYSIQLEQAYKNDRKAFANHWEQTVPGCTAGHTFR